MTADSDYQSIVNFMWVFCAQLKKFMIIKVNYERIIPKFWIIIVYLNMMILWKGRKAFKNKVYKFNATNISKN